MMVSDANAAHTDEEHGFSGFYGIRDEMMPREAAALGDNDGRSAQ